MRNKYLKRILQLLLDEGEAEAIVLALEANANLVLLDDREARLQAKRLGLIENLREELNKLKETGFRISESLEEEVLKAAEES